MGPRFQKNGNECFRTAARCELTATEYISVIVIDLPSPHRGRPEIITEHLAGQDSLQWPHRGVKLNVTGTCIWERRGGSWFHARADTSGGGTPWSWE